MKRKQKGGKVKEEEKMSDDEDDEEPAADEDPRTSRPAFKIYLLKALTENGLD